MAIKRDKLDAVVSDLVRLRNNGKSDYSGRQEPLECCHIYGRRRRCVRWHPMNLVALTHSEHRMFTENPVPFNNWLSAKFGPDYLLELAKLANSGVKFTPRQIEGIYQHYKEELKGMKEMREQGVTHRIDFNFPDPIPECTPRKRTNKKKPSKFLKKVNGQVVLRGVKVAGKRDTEAA